MVKINPGAYKREAQQAETLSNLEKHTSELLHTDLVVASADTILFEHYRDLNNALIWLHGVHWEWLQVNMELCQKSSGSVYYRYIVLPYPYVLENAAKRRALVDLIVLNLHLHLWHGVVCAVKFLDPSQQNLTKLTREMNFFVIPEALEFFGLPAYYRSREIEQVRFTGVEYEHQQKLVQQWASRPDSELVWLFYDEAHFERKRLVGWHWAQLRHFFFQLYTANRTCSLCQQRDATQLDHLGPWSKGHYQTLPNYQILCGVCNRHKSDLELVDDPFALRVFIDPRFRSKALERTLREAPPWLGRIRRPRQRKASFPGGSA